MSAKNRAGLINKLFKVAKKEYDFIKPASNRNVFEHMLYGCCLENSKIEAADEAFAKLQENYCDWNEVRVTTVAELAEAGKGLGNPPENAVSLKQTLYGVFEKFFTYDLDFLKKENLGKSVTTFESFKGVTGFVISYVSQNGLGGHSIPIDRSMMSLFYVLGIVTEDEAAKGRVPGLERTISKSKGPEFFSVVHQLAVAFASSPFSTAVREKLLAINPEAKERFPKRVNKKKAAEKLAAEKKAAEKLAAEKKAAEKKAAEAKSAKKAPAASKKAAKKKATKKPAKVAKKKVAKSTKKATKKKATKKPATRSTAKKKTTKKAAAKKRTPAKKKASAKKSATKKLSKKKPR